MEDGVAPVAMAAVGLVLLDWHGACAIVFFVSG